MAIHNKKYTTKCKRWLEHTNLAHGQKPNMSSTPYPWPSPFFLGTLYEAPASLRNPWLSQPLVDDGLPNSKGVIILISYASCSHSLEPWPVMKRNINRRQKVYEEGWKNKGRGNSCTTIAPSFLYTPMCGFHSLLLPFCHGMWLGASPWCPNLFHHFITWHLPFEGSTLDLSLPWRLKPRNRVID